MERGTVLITGCSSGIGQATARRLAQHGWTVYATARNVDAIASLRDTGCRTLPLDVQSADSMRDALDAIARDNELIDILINSAGYSQSGALETLPIAKVRQQFETNVFGLLHLTQMVLPAMRGRRSGRIINVGSMGGRFTLPGGGAYHATKYAVESLSDALRFELRQFGIHVVLIEPGMIRTGFGRAAADSMDEPDHSPYSDFNRAVARITEESYRKGPLAHIAGSPETVAAVIERAMTAPRPRTRYLVTPSAYLLVALRRVLPDRTWDAFLRTTYPSPQ